MRAAAFGLVPVMPARSVVRANPRLPRVSLKATGGIMRSRIFRFIFASVILKWCGIYSSEQSSHVVYKDCSVVFNMWRLAPPPLYRLKS
jgi:hypothetical protein